MTFEPTTFDVSANGLRFSCLSAGEGPLVLLLHGFPDNAWTWEHQLRGLAEAGFRAVAPYLRGHPPSDIPAPLYCDRASLACDVAELVKALEPSGRCALVGQDWGASIAYGALAAFPEHFTRGVVMAIPHPATVMKSLIDPEQVQRAFHWWFFQLPDLPERLIESGDYQFIDYLWREWSVGPPEPHHIERVKAALSAPGALAAALAYYRAMFNPNFSDPSLAFMRDRLAAPIAVPTLALCGAEDIRVAPMRDQSAYFTGPYRYEEIASSGHFLHREKPALITKKIVDWINEKP